MRLLVYNTEGKISRKLCMHVETQYVGPQKVTTRNRRSKVFTQITICYFPKNVQVHLLECPFKLPITRSPFHFYQI